MAVFATWQNALSSRRQQAHLPSVHKSDYDLGGGTDAGFGGLPFAYLVEQAADTVIRPHFHVVEQFQVVLAGTGSIGRRGASRGFVHYSAPYTGYGPITAQAGPLHYLTLRPRTQVEFRDQLAQYLPEKREIQRSAHRRPATSVGTIPPPPRSCGALDVLGGPDLTGPFVQLLHVKGGEEVNVRATSDPAFVYVWDGEVEVKHAIASARDLFYLDPGDELELRSAARGAVDLLFLRFPPAEAGRDADFSATTTRAPSDGLRRER